MADEPYQSQDPGAPGDPPDATDDDIVEAKRPWWYRAGLVVLAVALLLFLTPAIAHLFFPPVNPHQKAPPGHFSSECWACHDMSANVTVKVYD